MSVNYPNRADWLRVRATPRIVGTRRFLHVSTRYGWLKGLDGVERFVRLAKGVTRRR